MKKAPQVVLETPIVYLGIENEYPVNFMVNNRAINKSLVKKLKVSMEKHGILSALTVYDTGNSYLIVDGQHRWSAAKELGLSMPAIVTTDLSAMQAVMEMNTIGKNWSIMDYVEFYSNHDDPAISRTYSTLMSKKEDNPEYNYGSLHRIYATPIHPSSIKEGIIRITSEGMGDAIIRQIEELVNYIPLAKTTRFIQAYAFIANHDDYNHARMMRKIQGVPVNSRHLICPSNPTDYGKMLTKIYNRNQTKNLTIFRSAWL